MHKKTTMRGASAQPLDFLGAALRSGKKPTLKALLALAPPGPLMPPSRRWVMCGRKLVLATEWTQRILKLCAQYPSLQPDYAAREHMKEGVYKDCPEPGALANGFIKAVINHARAWWSREVLEGRTQDQFEAWLRQFVAGKIENCQPMWGGDPGWDEAYQLLRCACGLPRFLPSNPEAQK